MSFSFSILIAVIAVILARDERFDFITTYLSDIDVGRNAGRVATDDAGRSNVSVSESANANADAGADAAAAAAADESSCEGSSVVYRVWIEAAKCRFALTTVSRPSTLTSMSTPASASASASALPLASESATVFRRLARQSRRRPRRRNPRARRCSHETHGRRSAKNPRVVLRTNDK